MNLIKQILPRITSINIKLTFLVLLPTSRIIDLQTTTNSVLAILAGEHNAQSKGSVGNVVVEIILKTKKLNIPIFRHISNLFLGITSLSYYFGIMFSLFSTSSTFKVSRYNELLIAWDGKKSTHRYVSTLQLEHN